MKWQLLAALSLIASSAQAGPTAITGVRVEVGDGSVIESATVVLDKGKIVSVGEGEAPAGATVVDGAGKVLTPGFVELVSRLGLSEVGLEKSTNDNYLEFAFGPGDTGITPAFRAADGFNPNSTRIPIGRVGGVTSVVSSPYGGILYGAGAWFEMTGQLEPAPDFYEPVALYGGMNPDHGAGAGGSRGGVWLRLRQAFADARAYQKDKAGFSRGASRPLSLPTEHLDGLAPLLKREIPLIFTAHRASDILAAIRFAGEEKIRLVINGGVEAWQVADRLAAAKIPVIVKPSMQVPMSFDAMGCRDDGPALLRQAGVQVIFTSDDWDNPVRRIRQEAGIAVAFGFPRAAALQAITLDPARILGKDKELGTVAVGKRANVVLWSGDPLENDTLAEGVWIDGVAQSLEDRQLQLAKRYRRGKL